ncbi:MAG: hypothetical protein E7533_06085 [Ruminococcaceae bacterium]|nr:hypothetical protein [Oscillospiraceae bacterium]
MLRFFRFINGYIYFCAEGGFSERFINLCKLNDITLWDVKNDGVKVFAFTSSNCLTALEDAAINSGMNLKIEQEKGLKTLVNKHKWRFGIFVGIGVFLLSFWFASGFVWEVEVVGVDNVMAKNFTEELQDYGIKTGVKKSDINIIEVEKKIKSDYKNISWVSVNVFGGKVQVQLREAEVEQEKLDHSRACNIVASKNGEVILVKGYYGQNVVKEGDFVAKGSLLISGISAYSDGSEHSFHAKGEVLARTETEFVASIEANKKIFVTGEWKNRFYFCFFGLEIPIGFIKADNEKSETMISLKSGKDSLPVGLKKTECFSISSRNTSLSKTEAELSALLEITKEKRKEFGNVKFESIDWAFDEQKDIFSLKCMVKCIEDIAVEKEFDIQENIEQN